MPFKVVSDYYYYVHVDWLRSDCEDIGLLNLLLMHKTRMKLLGKIKLPPLLRYIRMKQCL
jgi:hypothetical protein